MEPPSPLIIAALVLVAVATLLRGGPPMVGEGLTKGGALALSVAPQILIGFALAGLMTVVIPSSLMSHWLGEGSGLQGILIATIAGILTPGGPYLQFPLVAGLANAGAAWGPVAAYLTAWSLIGVNRAIVWELPLLGASFTGARWLVSILVPIFIGLLTPLVMRFLSR